MQRLGHGFLPQGFVVDLRGQHVVIGPMASFLGGPFVQPIPTPDYTITAAPRDYALTAAPRDYDLIATRGDG